MLERSEPGGNKVREMGRVEVGALGPEVFGEDLDFILGGTGSHWTVLWVVC